MVQINGLLYAMGGNDGSNSLNIVECYSPAVNKWTVATSMNLRRSGLGAVVMSCNEIKILPSPATPPMSKSVDSKSSTSSDEIEI